MTREEAIRLLKQWNPIHPAKKEAVEVAVEALKQREIVSCDKCKWWSNFTCQNDNIARQISDCGCYPDFETDGDFFCKWGEKDGDGE